MLEYIRQQRPDTKWVVHLLTNVTFYVNKINEHSIGASVLLPDYILKNPGLYNDDNLCLFRCLAVHREAPVSDQTLTIVFFQFENRHFRSSFHSDGTCLSCGIENVYTNKGKHLNPTIIF
jgi:hypothetical protein